MTNTKKVILTLSLISALSITAYTIYSINSKPTSSTKLMQTSKQQETKKDTKDNKAAKIKETKKDTKIADNKQEANKQATSTLATPNKTTTDKTISLTKDNKKDNKQNTKVVTPKKEVKTTNNEVAPKQNNNVSNNNSHSNVDVLLSDVWEVYCEDVKVKDAWVEHVPEWKKPKYKRVIVGYDEYDDIEGHRMVRITNKQGGTSVFDVTVLGEDYIPDPSLVKDEAEGVPLSEFDSRHDEGVKVGTIKSPNYEMVQDGWEIIEPAYDKHHPAEYKKVQVGYRNTRTGEIKKLNAQQMVDWLNSLHLTK